MLTGNPPMVRTFPAGVIFRPSGRMTLPSLLRAAGSLASSLGAAAVQVDWNFTCGDSSLQAAINKEEKISLRMPQTIARP